jgi:hypothetical protein
MTRLFLVTAQEQHILDRPFHLMNLNDRLTSGQCRRQRDFFDVLQMCNFLAARPITKQEKQIARPREASLAEGHNPVA